MNSTNNSFEIAAKKVFSDLYALIKEDDKPFKFDLSIMPDDVVTCIGKHLEDYPFESIHTKIFPIFISNFSPLSMIFPHSFSPFQ